MSWQCKTNSTVSVQSREQKGKSREQEPAIVEQRPEIKGQRAKSREHSIMHTGQVFAQSRSLIAHPSIRAQAPRCEQNWILGGRGDTCTVQGKWLVSVVNRINQIGAISLMASPQDLETWLDSVTQYVCVTSQESGDSEHTAVSGISMQSPPNAGTPSAHSVHWLSQLSRHSPLHL